MTVIEKANNATITTDKDGRLIITVDGHPQLRIENVATMQLNLDSQQYVSRTKDGVFIARRHSFQNCWCGRVHHASASMQIRSAKPIPFTTHPI
jgi:flagellar basal body rod protein FlgF